MNLSSSGNEVDWRRRIMLRMGELGFTDAVEEFVLWRR